MTTERLEFRRWGADDLGRARALWGSPEVARLISAGGRFSEEEVAARLEAERASQAEAGLQYWPLFLRADGRFVGCCGLRPYREDLPELGFHLLAEFWGQGLAREAAEAVIAYAFGELGVAALFAGHHPENQASRRLLSRLGFVYTHDEPYPGTGLDHPSYQLSAAGDP